MDNEIKKCCPNCSQFYNINSLSPKTKGNLPLFLPCGHSMCENCIMNVIKFMEPFECKVCHHDVEVTVTLVMLEQNKTKLYELFPVNHQMVGELFHELQNPEITIKKANDEEHFIDLNSLLKSSESTQGECLECHKSTFKMCQQCAQILCDTCFNKTHKNFVIFKNHVLQSIESVIMRDNNCKVHSGKPLEYYCKDCVKPICMDCMMVGGEKSCKNHNVVPLQEVNEDFLKDITEVSPKVDETFRRLTKTAVDIGYLLYNFDNESGSASEFNKIIAGIEQHFSKLYSIVQKHKNEMVDIVLKLKKTEKESLLSAKTDVADAIKKGKQVMNMINMCSDPKKLKQLNLASLLEDAKQIAESPWYLNRDETNNDPLKLTVNEDICPLVNDYIQMEGNANPNYKLCTAKELSADIELPAPPPAPVYPPELTKDVRQTQKQMPEKENKENKAPKLHKYVPQYRSKSGSMSSLNSSGSEYSNLNYVTQNDCYQKPIVHPVVPFAESQHPKQLYEGAQELIYISHIVDPHNFYVQRACHQGLVKEMLREFRNGVSLPKPSVNHVVQGKLYLAFNKTDNMWQRCRVIAIDRADPNKPTYQVFCFDFGSTEIVSIDRLRLLPPARVQSPFPLALNCSLANCQPKTGTWNSEDSFLIQNIIDNKQAVIHVRHITATSNTDLKLDCDVITYENGVSLAHALVFHDRAKMPNPKLPYPPTTTINEKPKLFMSHNDYKPDSVEEVYMTQIVSPDKFFVRKRHLQNVYEKLAEELEQEYSVNSNIGTVYLPEVGTVYAVSAGGWARGVVHELPGRGRARVLLPDCGALLLLHWTALRYLHARFTTQKALATECHLAGITPLNKKWSTGSVALLKNYENHLLELHVENNRENRGRGSIGVTLYYKTEDENIICLNNEMIKYKFAVSFGLNMFNKDPKEKQVIIDKSPFVSPKPKPNHKGKEKPITILKKQPKKVNNDDLEAKDKGPLRLEAKVLHYQSPSLIYVSLVHQQKTFNELFEMMQKYYSNKKAHGKEEWCVGDRCCTLCIQSQTWRRAVILELEADNAKVFYSDFACVETVPTSSLKEPTPEFAKIGDAAIKCHLCGVIPAVGGEWPSITKEYLKELLDAYKRVFITKLGNFKDKSMPVEIWVYHTISGSALEPNKSEWRCLNKKIIEQGLGIPDKAQIVPASENTTDDGDDMLSFLNITGSVNQWLQLEPIPTAPLKTLKSESGNTNSSSPFELEDNAEKQDDGEESSNVMYITDWLPPEPFPCKEFTALPTYIDNDGVIYLHDVSQQDTLDLIRKALDVRFKSPDPKAKYTKWCVGEPCVALFFLDNRFYRGRILEVNAENSTCLIHYIDYGNEELCTFSNLRKSIALHQVPIQAHKCVLNRIRPIGKTWDRQTLDYIHKSIVEKQCYVKVTSEEVNGVIPIELKYNKLWINDHLVDFEMAEYTDGSKPLIKKFAPVTFVAQEDEEATAVDYDDQEPDYIVEEDTNTVEPSSTSNDSFDFNSIKGTDWNKLMQDDTNTPDGTFVTYPKITDKKYKCVIEIINDVMMLPLTIIHDDETTAIYQEMFKELQDRGENMPPLNGIYENKACLALFPQDGQWYRATVLQHSENKIKVRYVDFGNIEVLPLNDTRELPEEYVKLPPVCIVAKLHGVQPNPEVDINIVTKEYVETFIDKGPFEAEVIDFEDAVPMVVLRNEDDELVYNSLIENNVFLKVE